MQPALWCIYTSAMLVYIHLVSCCGDPQEEIMPESSQATLASTPHGRIKLPSGQSEPQSRAAGDGAEPPAEALIEALDGSERKLLLIRLAHVEPAAVAAGTAWLAEYHAANAERRRADRNRKSKDRRRRKRAELPRKVSTSVVKNDPMAGQDVKAECDA
jgi:hypothetical protein